MALAPRLDLRQTQTLVMTPQLQQAIKLLQMTNIELAEFVEQELERNPLLESEDEALARHDESNPLPQEERDSFIEDRREHNDSQIIEQHEGMDSTPLDIEPDLGYEDEAPYSGGDDFSNDGFGLAGWEERGGQNFGSEESSFEANLSQEVSLRDFLLEQINMSFTDPAKKIIAAHLMDMLDASGYLSGDISEVANTLGCPVARVEEVLAVLQQFDPAGIFARNLQECLTIQLKELNRFDPAIEALLENLELLAKRDYLALQKICGVDNEDLAEMVEEIKSLNPRPASSFENGAIQAVIPDIIMRIKADGSFMLELNPATLPRVLINNNYFSEIKKIASSKEDKSFLNEHMNSASWLVKSLHQRATTILKTTTEIVKRQENFFRHGIEFLTPLTLKDIAEAVEMHESTISRVTSGKYMSTPRGMFELKYFFTQAIAGTSGEAHSAESVRHRIKALIDAEAPDAILSDDTLVELLKKEGIDIARRTVAKYREGMNIGSSVQRRREKKGI